MDEMREMATSFAAFRSLLGNIQRGLATADLTIFELYAEHLVPDVAVRSSFVDRIIEEFAAAHSAVLEISGPDALLAQDETLARAIVHRNPYVDPMSYLQVRLIRDFRASGDPVLRDGIRLTINGIAPGLRVTG